MGYFDGVAVRSKKLFDAIAGEKVDLKELRCQGCAAAAKNDGVHACCGTAFAHGKAYKSKYAYRVALGEAEDPAEIRCGVCRKAAADHGWCDACKQGLVGNRVFKDKQAYQDAAEARKILVTAAKLVEKCPGCAIALVSDGNCPKCDVSYKDGKRITATKKEGEE